MEKPIKKRKKIVKGIIISFFSLLVIYFGMAIYFMNHFYFGSSINSVSVSGKMVEDVNNQMASEIKTFKLNIKERGGITEQISGDKFDLKYNSDGKFKDLKDKQNPYKWVAAVFNSKDSKMIEQVKYDKDLLKKQVDNLSCFNSSNIIQPKNPSFKYEDNGYVIVAEIPGNKGNKNILYDKVIEAVNKGETTIDLDSINYYVKPQYNSKSKEIIDTKNMLNKYVSSKITYTFGEDKELLDSATINNWLKVDENNKITISKKDVINYIDELARKYNTFGNNRNFLSTTRKSINVSGGNYGWIINKPKEVETLIVAIKDGAAISKDPSYNQKALFHGGDDIGNTYVEVDLTAQHLWFYKNGAVITQGDIVTGNEGSKETKTPAGVYGLQYKERNATLKGRGYASPVNFWMPFNGGIGIHDASWRSTFGGRLYVTGGSHGCVNSPYELAKKIFENIDVGTPIVCYY